MVSSFFGLFTSQRALTSNQAALNLVGKNIANANTEGYSRQKVSLTPSLPYPTPGIGTQTLGGTFNSGADIETITRTRDTFLDAQYRLENTTQGYYTERSYTLNYCEDVLLEPSDSSISKKLNDFFDAANQLSIDPQSLAVRTDFIQQALGLTEVLNHQASSLEKLRESLVGDFSDIGIINNSRFGIAAADINKKLEYIAEVNKQIQIYRGNGMENNDLLDQRDRLLDELSGLMPFSFQEDETGTVDVYLGNNALVRGGQVANLLQLETGDINNPVNVALIDPANHGYPPTGPVSVASVNNLINNGEMGGMLELASYSSTEFNIKSVMDRLDLLASEIASQVNTIQANGQYIDSATGNLAVPAPPLDRIFVDSDASGTITAKNITISTDMLDDPNNIAAASATAAALELGSNQQALKIAQLRTAAVANLGSTSFTDFQTSTTTVLGVENKTNTEKMEIQEALLNQVDLRREAISGVNIDEELIDMIRFQRAFEASSKVMSTMNQILDIIINRLG